MKQFEEWWKNATIDENATHKDTVKLAWRAALRWAKSMHGVSSEPRFVMNIKEELGDT